MMAMATRAIFLLDFREIRLWSGRYDAHLVPVCGEALLDRLATTCLECGVSELLMVANALPADGLEAFCRRFGATAYPLSDIKLIDARLREDNDTFFIFGTPFFDGSVLYGLKQGQGLRSTEWRPEAPTGVYRLGSDDLHALLLESAAFGEVRQVFGAIADGISRISAAPSPEYAGTAGELLDIRDGVDVAIAEFRCNTENLVNRLETSVGGYWRKPIAEHMLLCNTRFPPKAFFHRLQSRIEGALTCYPSQQVDIATLVAEMTAQRSDYVAVGNGVTELILALYSTLKPTIAVPTPTFAGFQTPLPEEQKKNFVLCAPNFDLDVQAFFDFVVRSNADTAIVINPNNPTGRLVDFADMVWLIEALRSTGRRLIVDESFIDFPADGRRHSVESLVSFHDKLIVVKSLGKVFGLGGMRLGYLMSSDTELVACVRRKLPLWNINGVAECALFLLAEFLEELEDSLTLLRSDREHFQRDLKTVPGLEVVPSQTNFVLCRLPQNSPSAAKLKHNLIRRESVLVRECGYQTMKDADRYLRLSVRSPEENQALVNILKRNLGQCTGGSESSLVR